MSDSSDPFRNESKEGLNENTNRDDESDESVGQQEDNIAGPSHTHHAPRNEYPFGPPTSGDAPHVEALGKGRPRNMESILASEIQMLKQKISSLTEQKDSLEQDNDRLRRQRDIFQSPLRETSELLLALEERNEQLEDELKELTEDRDELADMVESLTEGNRRLVLQIEEDRVMIQEAQSTILQLRNALEEAQRRQESLAESQRTTESDVQMSVELLRLWRRLQETSLDRLNPQVHHEVQPMRGSVRPAFAELVETSNTEIERILEDASLIPTPQRRTHPSHTPPPHSADEAIDESSPEDGRVSYAEDESPPRLVPEPAVLDPDAPVSVQLQRLIIENAELRRRLNDYSTELMRGTMEKLDEFDRRYQSGSPEESASPATASASASSRSGKSRRSRRPRRPDANATPNANSVNGDGSSYGRHANADSGFCTIS